MEYAPPPAPGMPIRRTSVSDQIRDLLREKIVSLDYQPGQSLSRTELATTFGVSQSPIRDAMMRLAEEGLLEIYPQSRTLVSLIDVAHASETQFLRLSLELEVTHRLAIGEKPSPTDELKSLARQMEAARDAGDMLDFGRTDTAFHRTMFRAVGAGNLWELVVKRSGHIDRLRKLNLPDPGKSERIIASHCAIIDAVVAGDPAGANAAVRQHLGETLSSVDHIRRAHPTYFST